MSAALTLLAGGVIGVVAGSVLVPFTRRELAASVARSSASSPETPAAVLTVVDSSPPRVTRDQWVALAVASGLLPAYVLSRVAGRSMRCRRWSSSSGWCSLPIVTSPVVFFPRRWFMR